MLLKLLKFHVFLSLFSLPLGALGSVITTSPQLTEILHQLGKYPDIAAGSAVPGTSLSPAPIGTLFLPSLERVIAVRAEWLLLDDEAVPRYLADRFARHLRQVFRFRILSPQTLFDQTESFLRQVYREAPPRLWTQSRACLNAVRPEKAFTYLAVVWTSPFAVAGQQTFLSGLLNRIGGSNLAPPTPWNAYPTLTEEWLTRHAPDRIYIFSDIPHAHDSMYAKARKLWPAKSPEIILIDSNHFARATFAVFQHLRELQLPAGLPDECQF